MGFYSGGVSIDSKRDKKDKKGDRMHKPVHVGWLAKPLFRLCHYARVLPISRLNRAPLQCVNMFSNRAHFKT